MYAIEDSNSQRTQKYVQEIMNAVKPTENQEANISYQRAINYCLHQATSQDETDEMYWKLISKLQEANNQRTNNPRKTIEKMIKEIVYDKPKNKFELSYLP